MSQILVVEDDPAIAKALLLVLRMEGFRAEHAGTAEKARELFHSNVFDLGVLDIGLPDGNGLDLCKEWRAQGEKLPLLFLTARTDEDTAVRALTLGANDYVRKPFGNRELVARIRGFLKETSRPEYCGLVLDPERREAAYRGEPLQLNRREFDILRILVRKAESVVTREEILQKLGTNDAISDRTVDSHVSHVRAKLARAAAEPIHILSVYGVGYRLEKK